MFSSRVKLDITRQLCTHKNIVRVYGTVSEIEGKKNDNNKEEYFLDVYSPVTENLRRRDHIYIYFAKRMAEFGNLHKDDCVMNGIMFTDDNKKFISMYGLIVYVPMSALVNLNERVSVRLSHLC